MIFEFELDPIKDVQPWGNQDDLHIHWYALTQGIYRLKVGDDYLLNYTDEATSYLAINFPKIRYKGTFVDYYLVRLWEDILDILPQILEPIPKELQSFVLADHKTQVEWLEKADNWLEKAKPLEENRNLFETATNWLSDRFLDLWYLSLPAKIWFWSDQDDVIISWDNQEILRDGFPVWSAKRGNYKINRNQFLDELRRFDKKLFSDMEKRVEIISRTWNNNTIQIDLKQLKSEQQNRTKWLEWSLKTDIKTDWEKVLTAINTIKNNSFE